MLERPLHPRLGKYRKIYQENPFWVRLGGLTYRVTESKGPARYGWYQQRGSLSAFYRSVSCGEVKRKGEPVLATYSPELSLEWGMKEPEVYIDCPNIWWFYQVVGYDYKKKKFI